MSKGLGYGKAAMWTPGAAVYRPVGGKVSASPEHVVAVSAALIRPGGRTPPVRACCPYGHETGTKFRFRLAEGVPKLEIEGAVTGSVYPGETSSAEQTSVGWSVYCTPCGRSGTVRSPEWVEERVLETIKRWIDADRPGPMRFRWT